MLVRVFVDCDQPGRGDPIQPRLAKRIALRKNCAQFCAHPQLETVTDRSRRPIDRKGFTGAENQRGSKQSHSVLIAFGRSLNQRVQVQVINLLDGITALLRPDVAAKSGMPSSSLRSVIIL